MGEHSAVEPREYPANCYFGYVCEASEIKGNEHMAGHVYFAHVPDRVIPESFRALRSEIEEASFGLLQLFPPDDPPLRQYFAELLTLAQMGLVCGQANPTAAVDALATLKAKIVKREGKRIKGKYLNKLLLVVAIAGITFLVAGILINRMKDWTGFGIWPGLYLYMLAVAMPAMWLSYATRKLKFRFEDLIQPEDDQMGPIHRVIYVVGFTLILALLGYLKIIGVFLGEFSTLDLGRRLSSAMIFGVICGLSEMFLATTVAPHIERVMKAMSQPSQGVPPPPR